MSSPMFPADHSFERPENSGSGSVLRVINSARGVPAILDCVGSFKCLTCEGYTVDAPVCQECRLAIQMLRAGPYSEILVRFLNVLDERPGLLAALEALTDEAVTEYFLGRIRQHREH